MTGPRIRGRTVPVVHAVLAATLAFGATISIAARLAIIDRANPSNDPHGYIVAFGTLGIWGMVAIILPLAGAILFGIRDWQIGRGPTVLRLSDAACLLLGIVLAGAVGRPLWWASMTFGVCALAAFLTTLMERPPRPAGWRR